MVDENRRTLQYHNELRNVTRQAIQRLGTLAEERKSVVTEDGKQVPRAGILHHLARELDEALFTVAVVGEFSRGKSTLINALLGRPDLLPTSIEPATAAVTVLTYGDEPSATVKYTSGREERNVPIERIGDYVLGRDLDGTQMQSHASRKIMQFTRENRSLDTLSLDEIGQEAARSISGSKAAEVEQVHIQVPADLLKQRIALVDTPGIGSVNPQHGEATRHFINQADAVIFLINTDPVISASECNFLTFLQDFVDNFLFVVTKIDRFTPEERERSISYTSGIIQDFAGIKAPKLYPVSASQALQALQDSNSALLADCGWRGFLDGLEAFLIQERGRWVLREFVTKARLHLEDISNSVELELQSVDLDIRGLQTRVEEMQPELEKARASRERIVGTIDNQIDHLDDLLLGIGATDWLRISTALEQDVFAAIDNCTWEQLQQADELIPIFVKEIVQEALQPKLDDLVLTIGHLRRYVVEDLYQTVDAMTRNIGFELRALRDRDDLDTAFELDSQQFRTGLQRVGTITIGSTLALTLAGLFLFGGIGAVVMIGGGLIARKQITAVFINRIKSQIKDAIRPSLRTIVDDILQNIRKVLEDNLVSLRANVILSLDGLLNNVEHTMRRLDQEMSSATFNAPERKLVLRRQQETARAIAGQLNQAKFFAGKVFRD